MLRTMANKPQPNANRAIYENKNLKETSQVKNR